MPLHVSSTVCSSSGNSKFYYTASGIITPVDGRPVHRLRADWVTLLSLLVYWYNIAHYPLSELPVRQIYGVRGGATPFLQTITCESGDW